MNNKYPPIELSFSDLSHFQKAAIIGYWRMGVPNEHIRWVMGCNSFAVEKVIYDRKLELNTKWGER